MSLHMGIPEVDDFSGVVQTAHAESTDGLRVMLRGEDIDYFFSDITYSQLPDVRVGDQIQILAEAHQYVVNDQAGAPVLRALAVESTRGTWTDSIFGDEVAPFTPGTWVLHDVIRWGALTLGILAGAFGLLSLVWWIRSRPRPVASPVRAIASQPVVGFKDVMSSLQERSEIEVQGLLVG